MDGRVTSALVVTAPTPVGGCDSHSLLTYATQSANYEVRGQTSQHLRSSAPKCLSFSGASVGLAAQRRGNVSAALAPSRSSGGHFRSAATGSDSLLEDQTLSTLFTQEMK